MNQPLHWHCVVALVVAMSPLSLLPAEEPVDYLRDIKPIFRARCYACHGALKQESGLRLDTGHSIRKGGDSGAAVVPEKPEGSLLLERISAKEAVERMPPEGEALSADQIARIRHWIAQGASSPKEETPEQDPRQHWAFQKLVRPNVPEGGPASLSINPIDRFIESAQKPHGLLRQPPARKELLLRRVYLDLIGLPPTREELQDFLADDSPEAYERVVERLLDSPQYGERWGRHWMDVWRYSDWYGRRHVPDVWNSAPQLWRWRDWIVSSLNEDHGYDRMIQEMLAGDEIAPLDDEAGYATGYLIRNWYALNPNDWMRSIVEHTGKSFLGLTFNCAHCHDHKYDPIAQDDYFRFRAFFEPIGIRQDRVPGEADPGPFQEYSYSTLRKIERLGAVRIYDKSPEAVTWFYTSGDERNRVKERGSIPPGVPAFLADSFPGIEPVSLPLIAWNPGLREGIQNTLRAETEAAVRSASEEWEIAKRTTTPSDSATAHLAEAEAAYESALHKAKDSGQPGALAGRQSLVLDATTGRRIVQNELRTLKSFDDGATLEFLFQIQKDAHFNFQLAKDHVKGLTAGYVGFDAGKILAYHPGTFSEVPVGTYDFATGQSRFHVLLKIEKPTDRCLLTIRSLVDDKLLVENVPMALNGWNPVGDPTKAISFDARTGSVVIVDEVLVRPPMPDAEPLLMFSFEPPLYSDGQDVIGVEGWISSSFTQSPATSVVSSIAANASLQSEWQKLAAARWAVGLETLPLRVAEARLAAANAEALALEARIQADLSRHDTAPGDGNRLMKEASRLERDAHFKRAEADVLAQELLLAHAEAKPTTDAAREKEIQAASQALNARRVALQSAREALQDQTKAEIYTPLGPSYPAASTGRRKALALWITSRDNPLTARVAVNHVWMRHFHKPLVASVYDFGRNGAKPTHPALLDWLAVELMDSGWSLKHLHKLIVTSAAYRRSSSANGAEKWPAIDPENQLLWRMNAGRMEAEVLRDSLLSCGGVLDLTMGGQELENDVALTTHRRSLYYSVHPELGGRNAMGELFDAPDPLECYRRTKSIIPQQALAMTNSELIHQMSAAVAKNLHEDDPANFIAAAFEHVLSRRPTQQELDVCLKALEVDGAAIDETNATQIARRQKSRESLVRALFNHNDFLTIR